MGQMIEFPANGGTCPGYLALPATGNANGRGVVVIQEWWGLVPHIKDVADRFAAEGYAALAPDLWRGQRTTNPDEAERLFMALNVHQAELDLRGAIEALRSEADITGKVGVVGFCMGGKLALLAATTNDNQVGAAVDFYGIHPSIKPDFSSLSCPVMGFFGDQDAFVRPSAVEELARDVDAAGGEFDYTIYPGAGHAFFNDARPEAYVPRAAADAWERTLSFLADHLEGEERAGFRGGAEADDEETDAEEVDVNMAEDEDEEDEVDEDEDEDDEDESDDDEDEVEAEDESDEDEDEGDEDESEEGPEVEAKEGEIEREDVAEEVDADRVAAVETERRGESNGAVRRGETRRSGAPGRARPSRESARNASGKAPAARKAGAASKGRKPAARQAAPARKAAPGRKASTPRKAGGASKAGAARKVTAGAKAGAARKAGAPRKPGSATGRKVGPTRKPPVVRKAGASKTRSSRKGK